MTKVLILQILQIDGQTWRFAALQNRSAGERANKWRPLAIRVENHRGSDSLGQKVLVKSRHGDDAGCRRGRIFAAYDVLEGHLCTILLANFVPESRQATLNRCTLADEPRSCIRLAPRMRVIGGIRLPRICSSNNQAPFTGGRLD